MVILLVEGLPTKALLTAGKWGGEMMGATQSSQEGILRGGMASREAAREQVGGRTSPVDAVPMFCGRSEELLLIMEQLDYAGLSYALAKDPIEALWMLSDPQRTLSTVIVPPDSDWLVFAGLVGGEFPRMNRLLVEENLSVAATTYAIRNSVVDDTLANACRSLGLYKALGFRLSGESCISCGLLLRIGEHDFFAPCLDRSFSMGVLDDIGGDG